MKFGLSNLLVIGVVCALCCVAQAQKVDEGAVKPEQEFGHAELNPGLRDGLPEAPPFRSSAAEVIFGDYVSVQANVDQFGNNVVGDAGNEPSIAVDPTNPSRIVIGWRQFSNVNSDFRQAGYGWTTDGGLTWSASIINPGVFRSDPVLAADAEGNIFYNSLTADEFNNFECKVYKSVDGGATWDNGVYAYGGDKQWYVIDQTDGIGHGNQYSYWTQYWSICYPDFFVRSIDGGNSFQSCTSIPNSPQWGTLAIGPDGELYVGGDGFTISRSDNAQDPGSDVSWPMTTNFSLGGSMGFSGGPNPAGLLGQLWIGVNHADGPSRGDVYALCSVNPSGSDPLDVHFARSTDGGQNWSTPVRVNDVQTGYQWFGTMSVAPNGRIDVVWLHNASGSYSALYYSYSEDGGITWSANEQLGPEFNHNLGYPQQNKMGDYFHMISDNFGAHLAYAATYNGEQDVYYLRIGDPATPNAGIVRLDSDAYACESTLAAQVIDAGLNVDPEQPDYVDVNVASTSEPAGETVTLTETGAMTSVFEGTLTLSETDGTGVLLVAEGDTVTVTYVDEDNGEGQQVNVTAEAVVDCTAPMISDVLATNVEARDATITFSTNEAAQGVVHYGTSCGNLNFTTTGGNGLTEHAILVGGLDTNTVYYFAVDAIDLAGNVASDDNGGVCYDFETPDVPDFFTEEFPDSGDPFNLTNYSMTFTPDGSGDFYRGCVEEITALPTDPAGGTSIPLSDDDSEAVSAGGGNQVLLYGVAYSSVYVGSNGYLTFTGTDTDYTESLADHFDTPRVSMLFDDLNPSNGGTVSYKQLTDRLAITYQDVPEYSNTGANTFQAELFFDGVIRVSYLAVSAQDAIVGLSEGEGLSPDYLESNLTGLGSCTLPGDLNCDGAVDFDDINPFVLALTGEANYYAEYPDCNWFNADIDGNGMVDFDDINPFVNLLGS